MPTIKDIDPDYQSTMTEYIPSYCKRNGKIFCGFGYFWNEKRVIKTDKELKKGTEGFTSVPFIRRNVGLFVFLFLVNLLLSIGMDALYFAFAFNLWFNLLMCIIIIGFNILLFGKLTTLLVILRLIAPVSWWLGEIFGTATPYALYIISAIPYYLIVTFTGLFSIIIASRSQKPIPIKESYRRGYGDVTDDYLESIIPYKLISKAPTPILPTTDQRVKVNAFIDPF